MVDLDLHVDLLPRVLARYELHVEIYMYRYTSLLLDFM